MDTVRMLRSTPDEARILITVMELVEKIGEWARTVPWPSRDDEKAFNTVFHKIEDTVVDMLEDKLLDQRAGDELNGYLNKFWLIMKRYQTPHFTLSSRDPGRILPDIGFEVEAVLLFACPIKYGLSAQHDN